MTIIVKNLHKSYGKQKVLTGLNFRANEGEIIGVIGENGAGKSTFLEIIMTLKTFEEGQVTILGTPLTSLSKKELQFTRQQISAVLQPTHFYRNLKVEELLTLFSAYYQSKDSIEQMMIDFKLEPYRKKYFDKLSGGWKQIISLAIAFLAKPKILILDEPTTGLDPHMRNLLWMYITKYNTETGGTVILSTHNMDEIELYCSKVLLIHEGRDFVFDSVENILTDGYPSIHQFYITSVAN